MTTYNRIPYQSPQVEVDEMMTCSVICQSTGHVETTNPFDGISEQEW